jgi:hypothetical protein
LAIFSQTNPVTLIQLPHTRKNREAKKWVITSSCRNKKTLFLFSPFFFLVAVASATRWGEFSTLVHCFKLWAKNETKLGSSSHGKC